MSNKPHIIQINENLHKICDTLIVFQNQLKIIKSDVECIKTYINQQEEIKKLDLPKKEEVMKGWFFT
jgi:hypothetical protein